MRCYHHGWIAAVVLPALQARDLRDSAMGAAQQQAPGGAGEWIREKARPCGPHRNSTRSSSDDEAPFFAGLPLFPSFSHHPVLPSLAFDRQCYFRLSP